MKKRLLALALCLVMMTSLLPVTAAADYDPNDAANWIVGIEDGKTYCKEVSFTINCPTDYSVNRVEVDKKQDGGFDQIDPVAGQYTISGCSGHIFVVIHFYGTNSTPYVQLEITINADHNWSAWTSNGNGTHSRTCGNGCVDSPQKEFCADNDGDCKCDDCKASMHTWQYTTTENSLTVSCQNCGIASASVTLTAHSVTLPESPFNARLEGLEQFKKEVPSAVIGDFVYKYKGSGDSEYRVVTPTAANAKAGEYQVGVRISGLPNKEYGPVEMSLDDEVIPDGAGYADLYVQYTAADPKVTAQTGDNRPIELMMGSVVVFSALAAAAFILDSKRRSRQ